jgi:hypothetical protein
METKEQNNLDKDLLKVSPSSLYIGTKETEEGCAEIKKAGCTVQERKGSQCKYPL